MASQPPSMRLVVAGITLRGARRRSLPDRQKRSSEGGRVGSKREREEEDDAKRGGLAWLRWREGVVRGLGDPSHYAE